MTISAMKLLQRFASMSLAESKMLIEDVIAGKTIVVLVDSIEDALELVNQLALIKFHAISE